MAVYEGKLVAPKAAKFAIVVGRFNEFITNKLLGGATDMLIRHDVADDAIDVVWSPGAFEIPLHHRVDRPVESFDPGDEVIEDLAT